MEEIIMVCKYYPVEFEYGNVRYPLWYHAGYTKGEKPIEFSSPKIYGFKSPAGQLIIINDNDDIKKILINKGLNEGLVKVIELTERLNNIENKLNDCLVHYRPHQHIDPISGSTGPLVSAPIPPLNIDKTNQVDIENENVKH